MTFRRKYEEKFFRVLSALVTCIIVFALAHIIWSIVEKGFSSLSWDIITKEPEGGFYFGKEGGILNAIAGSFYLAICATALAFVVAHAFDDTRYLNITVALFTTKYIWS